MDDLRPAIGAALDAFGLDATVTLPDASTVEARVFWLAPSTVEVPVGGGSRMEARRVLVVPLAGLSGLARGSIVSVPEYDGAETRSWKVDEVGERLDWDHYRVIVVPYTEPS